VVYPDVGKIHGAVNFRKPRSGKQPSEATLGDIKFLAQHATKLAAIYGLFDLMNHRLPIYNFTMLLKQVHNRS
jgi:hypothetical protein